MSLISDLLLSQIGGGQLAEMATAIGAPKGATEKAVAAAIPALVGGLARNATKSPDGAASLFSALERDHDGSLLDNAGALLGAFAGGGDSKGMGGLLGAAAGAVLGGGAGPNRATNGAGILKHVFGDKRSGIERAVGDASGLDLGQAGKLLALLAPLVMGALGKLKSEKGLDAGGLAGLLGAESKSLQTETPGLGGVLGLLDADGDGSVADDVTKIGGGLLKSFLSR